MSMKKVIVAGMLLIASSCTPVVNNDNEILYGTEWSIEDESEGVKFLKDDTVLFFSTIDNASGTFEYKAERGIVNFDGLVILGAGTSAEFTQGIMMEDGSMYLIWHPIGSSDTFKEQVFKRR